MPQSYYTTHALGPLLHISGLRPVNVSGFAVSNNSVSRSIGKLSDEVANFVVQLSNGALVNISSSFIAPRATELWWHLLGTEGSMENQRHWETDKGRTLALRNARGLKTYQVERSRGKGGMETGGHGGADLFLLDDFVKAVRGQSPNSIDVDLALAMTTPGILAHRSALQGAIRIEVPDLGNVTLRDQYRHDHASPFPIANNTNPVPPSVLGIKHMDPGFYADATKEDLDLLERVLRNTGAD
jgi:predicted dehydrogenase